MFKKLLTELYERVWKSYKSTLVGIGFQVLAVSLESFQTYLTGQSAAWAKVVLSLVGLALIFAKSKAVASPSPSPSP